MVGSTVAGIAVAAVSLMVVISARPLSIANDSSGRRKRETLDISMTRDIGVNV
ncbi:hypothetical protein ACWCPQ_08235 [Nocardia sp. NPDC001965]